MCGAPAQGRLAPANRRPHAGVGSELSRDKEEPHPIDGARMSGAVMSVGLLLGSRRLRSMRRGASLRPVCSGARPSRPASTGWTSRPHPLSGQACRRRTCGQLPERVKGHPHVFEVSPTGPAFSATSSCTRMPVSPGPTPSKLRSVGFRGQVVAGAWSGHGHRWPGHRHGAAPDCDATRRAGTRDDVLK